MDSTKAMDGITATGFASNHIVTPGELITSDSGFMRGHGTYSSDGSLYASIAGVVERVNKLISVRPLRARYGGEVGDVVICRILEIGNKRWKVDANAKQDAVLMLSSINLPGGIQRRKSENDELQMRSFFAEGDILSVSVCHFSPCCYLLFRPRFSHCIRMAP